MKRIYFCFGDYRKGRKSYRIFKVCNLQDAFNVADALGYEVVLDDCLRFNDSSDLTERMVVSILKTLEIKLHMIENVVSCIRAEQAEAQKLKKHFMSSDMGLYFPKMLKKPVTEIVTGPNGMPTMITIVRRTYDWIADYWQRKIQKGQVNNIDLVFLDARTKRMLNSAIREKRSNEET